MTDNNISRKDFISGFCETGGYSDDEMTEFIYEVELLPNISVSLSYSELSIQFIPEIGFSYPFISFSFSNGKSYVWINRDSVFQAMELHGFIPIEARQFFDFYDSYCLEHRPFSYADTDVMLYADMNKILSDKDVFIKQISSFSSIFTKGD